MNSKAPGARCWECPLQAQPCARTLFPKNKAVAAIVSRSPGYYESKLGKPFSGPSGKVLDYLLQENGITRDDVLITNTVLCSTTKEQGKVPGEAIKACSGRLAAEIAGIPLVIAAGSEAINLLIGRGAIERYRGYRIERGDRTYIAANNPAIALRDDSSFPNLRKDFKRAFNPIPEPVLPTVEVIEDVDKARRLISILRRQPGCVASDIESRGGLTHKASIVSMQFAVSGNEAYVLGERGGIWEDSKFINDFLRPYLESRDHVFIWHNGIFDIKILRTGYGIQARVDEDTLLQSYILDERGGVHALEYCLAEEFGWPSYEPKSVKEFKRTGIVTDYMELYEYAGRDAAGTYQLYELLSERIRDEQIDKPYRRLLLEGSEACTRIELAGFRYDIEAAADLMEDEVKPEFERKTHNLRVLVDNPIYNPRSTQQNAALFYDTWKVNHEMRQRPDKNRSTDVAALNEIVAGRFTSKADAKLVTAFAKELLRFRQLTKQADTYIVGMIERAIDDPDGKIYTDLLLHGTTSGRLSSRNPNLQNCYSEDTEILTTSGWKLFKHLEANDKVAQWSKGNIEFVTADEIVEQDYTGKMISIQTETIDLLVTPNHRMLSLTRDMNEKIESAESYLRWDQGQIVDRHFVRGGNILGGRRLSEAERNQLEKAIVIQAEGSIRQDCYRIDIRVSSDRKKEQLLKVYKDEVQTSSQWGYRVWLKDDVEETKWLDMSDKTFKIDKLLELCADDLTWFLAAIHRWDGDFTRNATFLQKKDRIRAVEAVQLAAVLTGKSTQWYNKPGNEYVAVSMHKKPARNFSRTWVNEEEYAGKVYCVSVPSGFIVVRRNLNVVISGNTTRPREGLPNIRKLFLASPGRLLCEADFSQAELRCIAELSQDKELLRIYESDLDLHNETAKRFYGDNFTSEQRSKSKNVNFGMFYGQGAASFQEKHNIPEKEAQQYINWCWSYFTGVKAWKDEIIKEMKTGRVVSPFGRVRRFHLLTKENFNSAVREAVNFKPQSTAGDLTLRSVILLSNEVDWSKAAIVITVHDSVIADVQEDYINEYKIMCTQIMESRAKDELGWKIPFRIEIGVGPNWSAAK